MFFFYLFIVLAYEKVDFIFVRCPPTHVR